MIKAKAGLTIVTGPSKSGKSIWAENLIKGFKNVIYIATSVQHAGDKDWNERINIHKARRPKEWFIVESGYNLSSELNNIDCTYPILIDSLGGFVSTNIENTNKDWIDNENNLILALGKRAGISIIVIEEIGWGVVPTTKIGNIFRDRMGSLALKLQNLSTDSWLVIQGRAINLPSISFSVE